MIHSSAAFFNPMISYSGHFSPSSFSGPETVDTRIRSLLIGWRTLKCTLAQGRQKHKNDTVCWVPCKPQATTKNPKPRFWVRQSAVPCSPTRDALNSLQTPCRPLSCPLPQRLGTDIKHAVDSQPSSTPKILVGTQERVTPPNREKGKVWRFQRCVICWPYLLSKAGIWGPRRA